MNHPSLDDIKQHLKAPQSAELQAHIENCETCAAIRQGLLNLQAITQSTENEAFIEESKASTFQRIGSKSNTRIPNFFAYAAVLAAIVVSAILVIVNNTGQDLLDQELSSVYPVPTTLRSPELSNGDQFVRFYQKGDFENAKKALNQAPTSAKTIFYRGMVNLYLEEPNYFETIALLKDPLIAQSIYQEDAQYYLLLCALKTQQLTMADSILIKMEKLNSRHTKLAQRLLERGQN